MLRERRCAVCVTIRAALKDSPLPSACQQRAVMRVHIDQPCPAPPPPPGVHVTIFKLLDPADATTAASEAGSASRGADAESADADVDGCMPMRRLLLCPLARSSTGVMACGSLSLLPDGVAVGQVQGSVPESVVLLEVATTCVSHGRAALLLFPAAAPHPAPSQHTPAPRLAALAQAVPSAGAPAVALDAAAAGFGPPLADATACLRGPLAAYALLRDATLLRAAYPAATGNDAHAADDAPADAPSQPRPRSRVDLALPRCLAAAASAATAAPLTGTLIAAAPLDGCFALRNAARVRGAIAVLRRGGCAFATKIAHADAAGAIAAVVVNASGDEELITMGEGDADEPCPAIPAVLMRGTPGDALLRALAGEAANEVADAAARDTCDDERAEGDAGRCSASEQPCTEAPSRDARRAVPCSDAAPSCKGGGCSATPTLSGVLTGGTLPAGLAGDEVRSAVAASASLV